MGRRRAPLLFMSGDPPRDLRPSGCSFVAAVVSPEEAAPVMLPPSEAGRSSVVRGGGEGGLASGDGGGSGKRAVLSGAINTTSTACPTPPDPAV